MLPLVQQTAASCSSTLTAFVPPLEQQPRQRSHVAVVLAGADVAGGARSHGLQVVRRGLGHSGHLIISDSKWRRRRLGLRFLRGATEGEAGEAAEPFETFEEERKK